MAGEAIQAIPLRDICFVGGTSVIGFRKIYGVNWLDRAHTKTIIEDDAVRVETLGKLPAHWNDVREILLNQH